MKSEVKEISATEREIHIQIEPETLKQAYSKVSEKYARGASVPGFRKGYAPVDVIRLRYKEEIRSEVLQQVLPPAVNEAIREHGLQPLAEPNLHIDDADNIKVNGSQPINLHVHVEVMPEIPEPKYEGIEVTRRVKPVDESEVEDLIANRLNQEAALIPVEDRPSETGDTVVADLEGRFEDDPDGQPITAEDIEIKLGDEAIEKSFTENLVGVRAEDEKEFTVAYPEDFSSKALAGRTVHYKARIKNVGRMETPEPNDEWARSLDEGYESLADLRNKLRADLETYAKSDADARVRNTAIAKLIEDNAFDVPNVLIDSQARNLLDNFARDLQQRGVDLNQVDENFIRTAYAQMRTQAERDVRGAMLLDKVAERENVKVSPEEVDEEIGKIAEMYRATPEDIRKSLERQGSGTATIENNLRTRKSVEALISKAKVTEGEWVEDETPEAMTESKEAAEEKPKKVSKAKAKASESAEPKPKAARKKSAKSE